MTPKQRADKLVLEWTGMPLKWEERMSQQIEQAITAALEEKDKRIAELESVITHSRQIAQDAWLGHKIKVAVEEECEACADIVYEQFMAYRKGRQPASALVAAEAQIRARCDKSAEARNENS